MGANYAKVFELHILFIVFALTFVNISNVHKLPRTGFDALKAIEDQTGWKGTLLLGGPNPETGGLDTIA